MPQASEATACAICGTTGNAKELYPANFKTENFSPEVFSARRLPDQIHYRIIRCSTCGLVRSDPVMEAGIVNELYTKSKFTYENQVADLKISYGRVLRKLERWTQPKGSLLEVGCGNGFFLEEALRLGYPRVYGIEPSTSSVEQAREDIRPNITCAVLREDLFPPAQFDVICFFQTFDHLPDPRAALRAVFRFLKPGGMAMFFNHNIEAFSSRMLGEKSPIIDIEHTYLYSLKTMRRVVEQAGLRVLKAGTAVNTYSIEYLFHLLPVALRSKKAILSFLKRIGLSRIRLTLPLGNLYLIAQKPLE